MIDIVLIEDDEVIQAGISFLINETKDFSVVAAFQSVEKAMTQLRKLNPQIILLDVELPGLRGIDSLPKIKEIVPNALVIILTVYDSAENVFDAFTKGASGYLVKDDITSKLLVSIREVLEGGAPMSMGVAKMVINSFKKNINSPLTKRETEVLQLVAEGKSRSKIAKDLFIEDETVKFHIKNIYLKLNVHSKDEAIKRARDDKYI